MLRDARRTVMPASFTDTLAGHMEAGRHGGVLACVLVAGYAYYIHDIGLTEDTLFDKACQHLLQHWSEVSHPHKHLLREDDLRAGSLYAIPRDAYPLMTRVCAHHLIDQGATP